MEKRQAPYAWRTAERGKVPAVPGCYVVFSWGRVVYVGSTINLRARTSVYRTRERRRFVPYCDEWRGGQIRSPWPNVPGESITIKYKATRRNGDWLMREWRLIDRLVPHMNTIGVTRGLVG